MTEQALCSEESGYGKEEFIELTVVEAQHLQFYRMMIDELIELQRGKNKKGDNISYEIIEPACANL